VAYLEVRRAVVHCCEVHGFEAPSTGPLAGAVRAAPRHVPAVRARHGHQLALGLDSPPEAAAEPGSLGHCHGQRPPPVRASPDARPCSATASITTAAAAASTTTATVATIASTTTTSSACVTAGVTARCAPAAGGAGSGLGGSAAVGERGHGVCRALCCGPARGAALAGTSRPIDTAATATTVAATVAVTTATAISSAADLATAAATATVAVTTDVRRRGGGGGGSGAGAGVRGFGGAPVRAS
jgi:hypothetical protein